MVIGIMGPFAGYPFRGDALVAHELVDFAAAIGARRSFINKKHDIQQFRPRIGLQDVDQIANESVMLETIVGESKVSIKKIGVTRHQVRF